MPYAIASDKKSGYLFLASIKPPRMTTSKVQAIVINNLIAAERIAMQVNASQIANDLNAFFFALPRERM